MIYGIVGVIAVVFFSFHRDRGGAFSRAAPEADLAGAEKVNDGAPPMPVGPVGASRDHSLG